MNSGSVRPHRADLEAPSYPLMPCLVSGHLSAGEAVKTTAEMFVLITVNAVRPGQWGDTKEMGRLLMRNCV